MTVFKTNKYIYTIFLRDIITFVTNHKVYRTDIDGYTVRERNVE